MRKHNRLTQSAIEHLPVIVEQTKNFTGNFNAISPFYSSINTNIDF